MLEIEPHGVRLQEDVLAAVDATANVRVRGGEIEVDNGPRQEVTAPASGTCTSSSAHDPWAICSTQEPAEASLSLSWTRTSEVRAQELAGASPVSVAFVEEDLV